MENESRNESRDGSRNGSSIERLLSQADEALGAGWKWPLGLALAAFVVKAAHVGLTAGSLQNNVLIMDAKQYDETARDILAGNVIRREAFFFGPMYSYFLAVAYSIFGRDFTIVRLIQAAGGSATVVLTYLLGKRVFRPSIGFLAAALLILYGAVTFYETQILMMWMGTLLNTAMLLLLVKTGPHSGWRSFVLPGFVLGISVLARANVLIFWLAAIVWILFVRNGGGRWVKAAAFSAAVLVPVLPVTIHNYVASREFVPVTSNAGLNFYIGNNENATGVFYPLPGVDILTDVTTSKYVERITGRDMSPSEVSRYWFDKAFAFIRANPGKELRLILRKAAMFFNAFEVPQIESYDMARRRYGFFAFLPVNFWFLGTFGLLGFIFAFFHWRRHFLLQAYVVLYALSIVAFFVTARYRVQIAPVMAVFAAYAILGVLPASFGNVRRGTATAGLLFLIAFVLQPGLFAMDEREIEFRDRVHEARRAGVVGRYDYAVKEMDSAIELYPEYYEGYVHRAIIHKEGNNLFKAIENYTRALDLRPDMPGIHYDLAQAFRRVNLKAKAVEEYQKAIALDSLMIKAYNNLGITFGDMRKYGEAAWCFDRVIRMDPDYIKAYNNLGVVLAESGRVEEAIVVLLAATERDSTYATSYKNLANAYVLQKQVGPAIEALDTYLRFNPGDEGAAETLKKLHIAQASDSSAVDGP